jgi:hypothetical protein
MSCRRQFFLLVGADFFFDWRADADLTGHEQTS